MMNNKHKILRYLILAVFVGMILSCDKSLERKPAMDDINRFQVNSKNSDWLTIDNFQKIKQLISTQGEHVIWSSLYGEGIFFHDNEVEIIYTPGKVAGEIINAPWDEFLKIVISEKGDEKYSFQVINKGSELEIEDSSNYYYKNKVSKKRCLKELNYIFKKFSK